MVPGRILLTLALLTSVAVPAHLEAQPQKPSLPASSSVAQPSEFLKLLEANFDRWDTDHNGELTRTELDKATMNPAETGPTAATLVALKRSLSSKLYPAPKLTKDTIRQLVAAEQPTLRTQPNFDQLFTSALKRISAINRNLFPSGVPRLEMLHQGRLGDCFCLAPLGAMIHRDPQQVVKMFQPAADGSINVTLGVSTPLPIAPLTDAEIALSSNAKDDGIWVNLYEKAVGQHSIITRASLKSKPDKASSLGNGTEDEPGYLDVIGKGGSAGKVLALITGHRIKRISCSLWHATAGLAAGPAIPSAIKTTDEMPPPPAVGPPPVAVSSAATANTREAKLQTLRQLLTDAVKDKRLICAGTPATNVSVPGINLKHAYAILDYDPVKDTVLVWNPHGNTFHPKGDPGLLNGYSTVAGEFTAPLTEVITFFAGISIETDQPALP